MASVASREQFVVPAKKRWWTSVSRFVVTQPLGAAGAIAIFAMALSGLLSPYIAPYDPVAISFGSMMSPPSWEHLLGTYNFGRDILSRILY